MIRKVLEVEDKWKVIIYYDINYNLFGNIVVDLYAINTNNETINRIYNTMKTGDGKAVTVSNIYLHTSVVLFNRHNNRYDYINSIIHEAEHVKQSMLKAYNVIDDGEPPAYTVGYLAMKMMMLKDF